MARRRRKATKKAESEASEESSSIGEAEGDSAVQEEDSEGIPESATAEEDAVETANQETDEVEKVADDSMVTEEQHEEAATNISDEASDSKENGTSAEAKEDGVEVAGTEAGQVANMETADEAEAKGETAMTEQETSSKDHVSPSLDGEEKMETDTAAKDSIVPPQEANLGTKEDSDKDEEEAKAPVPKVEKEPTSAECYDNDNSDVPVDPEADEDEAVIGSESPEFLKFWRAVLDNPHDFTNWTYLLQLVEQENKPPLARRAYNGFFKHYPLCYGYWKKFSEMEKRNGNLVRAQRILERGVRAIPLSIDLWVHMIEFYTNFYKGPDAGKEKVRRVFERAVSASGSEFRSEKLWNKYIQWEQDNSNWKAVMIIYDRVLRIPTQHYAIFFKDYKDFVMSRSPKEILSYEEFNELLEEIRDEAEASTKADETTKAPALDDDAPPGVESDDRGKPPNDKELKAVCEKVATKKKKIFDETEALVTKIWTFEEGIKRPYFHVKALERTQIKNWRDYLEAEIARGEDQQRIILLFERCLIACALYEDFWLKYARFLSKTDANAARNVYRRACEIHLTRKPNIHMHWATFEELEGNSKAASKILEKLDSTLPNMAMTKMRRVAVERRAGNNEVAEALLKTLVANAPKGNEECFYARKYSWFLVKVSKKVELARQVLKDVIERNQDQVQLYKDLVGLEFMYGDEDHLAEACDLAITCQSLSEDIRFQFSQRKLEYLEDFGEDPKTVQKLYDEHQKALRNHKKRTQSQTETIVAQPITKKAKTDSSPVTGNKILSTGSTRYSTSTATNGGYSNPIPTTVYGQTSTHANAVASIQSTTTAQPQAYQQATGDASLYYQNYWNYQQKPSDPATQQYNYSQWPQYSQQQYYQQ